MLFTQKCHTFLFCYYRLVLLTMKNKRTYSKKFKTNYYGENEGRIIPQKDKQKWKFDKKIQIKKIVTIKDGKEVNITVINKEIIF